MAVKWVLTGMKFTPEELAGFLVEAMPRKLGEEFVRLGLLEEPRAHGRMELQPLAERPHPHGLPSAGPCGGTDRRSALL